MTTTQPLMRSIRILHVTLFHRRRTCGEGAVRQLPTGRAERSRSLTMLRYGLGGGVGRGLGVGANLGVGVGLGVGVLVAVAVAVGVGVAVAVGVGDGGAPARLNAPIRSRHPMELVVGTY